VKKEQCFGTQSVSYFVSLFLLLVVQIKALTIDILLIRDILAPSDAHQKFVSTENKSWTLSKGTALHDAMMCV
jgi:hypothetical protein